MQRTFEAGFEAFIVIPYLFVFFSKNHSLGQEQRDAEWISRYRFSIGEVSIPKVRSCC